MPDRDISGMQSWQVNRPLRTARASRRVTCSPVRPRRGVFDCAANIVPGMTAPHHDAARHQLSVVAHHEDQKAEERCDQDRESFGGPAERVVEERHWRCRVPVTFVTLAGGNHLDAIPPWNFGAAQSATRTHSRDGEPPVITPVIGDGWSVLVDFVNAHLRA